MLKLRLLLFVSTIILTSNTAYSRLMFSYLSSDDEHDHEDDTTTTETSLQNMQKLMLTTTNLAISLVNSTTGW